MDGSIQLARAPRDAESRTYGYGTLYGGVGPDLLLLVAGALVGGRIIRRRG